MDGEFYGKPTWDPVLISLQICLTQLIFYGTSVPAVLITDWLLGSVVSLDQVFSIGDDSPSNSQALATMWGAILTAILSGVLLSTYLDRARKCLDYAFTCHFFHLIVCRVVHGRFPATLSWWLVWGASTACMTLVSEHLCMRREMRVIPTKGKYKRLEA
eukprot:c18808_g1_i2.p2 GENE.c18808_g1_i2~~c18808_g1_i2.p2  ORF type:complete len:159 (+),score=34.68 c18808_g1_i2:45-521(+)